MEETFANRTPASQVRTRRFRVGAGGRAGARDRAHPLAGTARRRRLLDFVRRQGRLGRSDQKPGGIGRPSGLLGRAERRLHLRAYAPVERNDHHPLPAAGSEGRRQEAVPERCHLPIPGRVPGDPESRPEERLRLRSRSPRAALPCSPSGTRRASTWPTREPTTRSRSSTRSGEPPPRLLKSGRAHRLRAHPATPSVGLARRPEVARPLRSATPSTGSAPGGTPPIELIRASGGKIIIRYLPRGVEVGSPKPYLSVATYPFPGAFAGDPGARPSRRTRRRSSCRTEGSRSSTSPIRRASISPTRGRTTRSRSSTRPRPRFETSSPQARSAPSAEPRRRPLRVMSAEPASSLPGDAASRSDGSSGASTRLRGWSRCSRSPSSSGS